MDGPLYGVSPTMSHNEVLVNRQGTTNWSFTDVTPPATSTAVISRHTMPPLGF